MLWRQTTYQHVAERLHYLLRCCLVSLKCAYCPKKQFQKYGNSFISRTIPLLSSQIFGKCEKSWTRNLLWSMKFECRTDVSHFAYKKIPQTTSNPSLCRVLVKVTTVKVAKYRWNHKTRDSDDRLQIFKWSCTDISLKQLFEEHITAHCQVEKLGDWLNAFHFIKPVMGKDHSHFVVYICGTALNLRLSKRPLYMLFCLPWGAVNGVLFQGGHGVRFALVRSDCVLPLTIW